MLRYRHLLVLGLVDDRLNLGPLLRLFVELGAGVLLAVLLATSSDLPILTLLAVPIMAVIAVNSVNLFDGLDGLVGTTGSLAGIGIWLLGVLRGTSDPMGLLLVAALVGFLVWNWHPARLFLGDGGAHALGLTLVFASVQVSSSGAFDEVVIGFAMLGVILLDLVVTVVRRLRAGRPLFVGDRGHIYDQMADDGASVPLVVLRIAAWQAVIIAAVLAVDRIEQRLLSLAVLGVVAAVLVLAAYRLGYLAVTDGTSRE